MAKYLLSTSDKSLPTEDVALGYKQLMEVEWAFRTLKSILSLRPVYHTKDDRIRSHVMICWLALGPDCRDGDRYDLAEDTSRTGTSSFRKNFV